MAPMIKIKFRVRSVVGSIRMKAGNNNGIKIE